MTFDVNDLLTQDKKTIKDTKKNMGRPKKNIKSDERVVCYLTKEENTKFENIAEKNFISKSGLARKVLVEFIKEKEE